jgi:hypothetical protein
VRQEAGFLQDCCSAGYSNAWRLLWLEFSWVNKIEVLGPLVGGRTVWQGLSLEVVQCMQQEGQAVGMKCAPSVVAFSGAGPGCCQVEDGRNSFKLRRSLCGAAVSLLHDSRVNGVFVRQIVC